MYTLVKHSPYTANKTIQNVYGVSLFSINTYVKMFINTNTLDLYI